MRSFVNKTQTEQFQLQREPKSVCKVQDTEMSNYSQKQRRENAVRSQQWNHRKLYPKKVEMEFFIPKVSVKYLSFLFHRKFQTVMRFPSTLTVLKIPTN